MRGKKHEKENCCSKKKKRLNNSIAKDIPLEELARHLKEGQIWDLGLLRELCRRAVVLLEWQEADTAAFERIAAIAAKKLGVDIGIPEDMLQETAETDEDDAEENETEE